MRMQIRKKNGQQVKNIGERLSEKRLEKMGQKQASWQERGKMHWEQSEALYHIYDRSVWKDGQQPAVTGLHEAKEGYQRAGRMREAFKAENSYGNIALGVNKKKEAAFVMSQKREHNGPVTAEAQKSLRMERKKREIAPNGNFYMNPDLKQKGAIAFQAKLSLPVRKVLGQMRRYHAETGSQMMEKRLPHFRLAQERRQLKMLGERRRESRESGEVLRAEWYDCQIRQLQSRIGKQEQAEKQMMKKLHDAWQKARRMSYSDDMERFCQRDADSMWMQAEGEQADAVPEQAEGEQADAVPEQAEGEQDRPQGF